MICVARVAGKAETDPFGTAVLDDARRLGIAGVLANIRVVKVFRLEGLTPERAEAFAKAALVEFDQSLALNAPMEIGASAVREVGYKPGVMNPEAASILKTAADLGFGELVAADTSLEYHFFVAVRDDAVTQIVHRLLVNPTVQQLISSEPETLIITGTTPAVRIIPIRQADNAMLMALSENKLFLTLDEMHVIQEWFSEEGRDPTDAELETIAQTWSDHCKHKTFSADLVVDGVKKQSLFQRLRETSALYFGEDVLSAFSDNSGAVAFYGDWAVCGKVETHNAPSAVEPYGGAGTGIGGVIRDIMGTGCGARVILSTDIFCFAPPDLPSEELPPGCLPPDYLFRRVVGGVRDYGNRMGIPTANGSVHFHHDFRAKPTVIVGAYGIMPKKYVKKGEPQAGDLIIVVGGSTGRDGIHGATFSSAEMTDRTSAVNGAAVQIGNAIEEKRGADSLLICRDRDLIRAETDCGAGGFSSAIGEMGSSTGARVYLERALLKYPGLAPWEIWISESQERMVVAVAPENADELLRICRENNTPAFIFGEFTNSGRLVVTYGDASVCDLPMEFLHHGLPRRTMTATKPNRKAGKGQPLPPTDWLAAFKAVLSDPNVASKESIVRMYDHCVQGSGVSAPFTGVRFDGPSDAVVLRPVLDKPWGLVVSHGLNPILNRIDPRKGAIWAAVEALANLVATGGNYRESWLIDNFIWPTCSDPENLWALNEALEALLEVMHTFRRPFISGKDSLSSTYRRGEQVIHIPPVLCVSAFGKIPDVRYTTSTDFKRPNSVILLLGQPDYAAMGGSVYHQTRGCGEEGEVPDCRLASLPVLFDRLHELIQKERVLAVHDVSEGGILTAVFEMCLGGRVGALLHSGLSQPCSLEQFWLNETAGCFVVEMDPDLWANYGDAWLDGIPYRVLGVTNRRPVFEVAGNLEMLIETKLSALEPAWKRPIGKVIHA